MRRAFVILILLLVSGCSFSRKMVVTAKLKDGKYGIAKGDGYGVYQSETYFSFLQCLEDSGEK